MSNPHDTHLLSHERSQRARRAAVRDWVTAVLAAAALLFVGGYLDGREELIKQSIETRHAAAVTTTNWLASTHTTTEAKK